MYYQVFVNAETGRVEHSALCEAEGQSLPKWFYVDRNNLEHAGRLALVDEVFMVDRKKLFENIQPALSGYAGKFFDPEMFVVRFGVLKALACLHPYGDREGFFTKAEVAEVASNIYDLEPDARNQDKILLNIGFFWR